MNTMEILYGKDDGKGFDTLTRTVNYSIRINGTPCSRIAIVYWPYLKKPYFTIFGHIPKTAYARDKNKKRLHFPTQEAAFKWIEEQEKID